MSRTLLVTGASGHLGRRTVERLLARKAGRVIAATRQPEKIADLAAKGAEVRRADFDDPTSLDAAFAGVDRLLVISTDTVDAAGTRVKQAGRAIDAAKRAGVKHVAYTSVVKAKTASHLIAPDHRGTEALIEASGLGYTMLRNNLYTDLLLGSLPGAVGSGKFLTAMGEGRIAYVTREDCAEAAAAALASDFEGRRVLDITGPESVTATDLARLASEVSGRSIEVVPLSEAQLAETLQKFGLPPPLARFAAAVDEAISRHEFDVVSSAVTDLTGRAATSVRAFLTANKAALAPAK